MPVSVENLSASFSGYGRGGVLRFSEPDWFTNLAQTILVWAKPCIVANREYSPAVLTQISEAPVKVLACVRLICAAKVFAQFPQCKHAPDFVVKSQPRRQAWLSAELRGLSAGACHEVPPKFTGGTVGFWRVRRHSQTSGSSGAGVFGSEGLASRQRRPPISATPFPFEEAGTTRTETDSPGPSSGTPSDRATAQ